MRVHVVVADADPLIAEGLAQSLRNEWQLTAYPSTDPPEMILEGCRGFQSCVLLMSELYLDQMNLARFVRLADYGRAVPVLILGNTPDPQRALRCLRLGCAGYVHRQDSLATLRKAILAAASGEIWARRVTLTVLLRELFDRGNGKPRLTAREQEVSALIAQGATNVEIAGRLFISPETVRWHVRRLFAKLGVRERAAAAEFARQHLGLWPDERTRLPSSLPVERKDYGQTVGIANRV